MTIEDGRYPELAAYVEAEQERLTASENMVGPPAYVSVVRMETGGSSIGHMTAQVASGAYAVVCGNPGELINVTEAITLR